MKFYAWIMILTGLMAIPSCSSDSPVENTPTENEKPEKEEMITGVTAVLPTFRNMSRVQVDPIVNGENKDIYWNKGDQICLIAGKKYILDIDPKYDETQNKGQKTARFTTNEKMQPNIYQVFYPTDIKISGDTVVYENFLDEIDFTSAKTPEEKAKIWKSHIDKHMLLYYEGRLNGGEEEIELKPYTSIKSFTYTNNTGEERTIDAIEGCPLNTRTWINRRNFDSSYGFTSEYKQLITKGLTLGNGESMYFYFHIHASNTSPIGYLEFEYGDGLSINHIYKDRKVFTMNSDIASEVYYPTQLKCGEYTHVELIETKTSIFWNVPNSGVPVKFENKGLSAILLETFGTSVVNMEEDGCAVLDEMDVKSIANLNLNTEDLTSLDGIEKMENLEVLACYYTEVASCTLDNNKKLKDVYLSNNKLEYLDVSALTELTYLYCGNQRNNITLKLKLSEAQKEKWENEWSKHSDNTNVVLVD